MTSFRVDPFTFSSESVRDWEGRDRRHSNWPVVYTLNGDNQVYVGETLGAGSRMTQHLASPSKQGLKAAHVIIDDTFNKSACLDLESLLIRLFAGDGRFQVLNGNAGITNRDYYERESYQETFRQIFEELRRAGLFNGHIKDIENSDLFKLSPFKALTEDQAVAVADILDGILEDLQSGTGSTAVVRGDPGTGKTIVGIFMIKLLRDIQSIDISDEFYSDSIFAEYFLPGNAILLKGLRMALVVPQQSLRDSIRKVFSRTPMLDSTMVLGPYDVGLSEGSYDLLVVDETHRLNQRANQSSGTKNRQFSEINITLFGEDDPTKTQLDWVMAKSTHQIFLVDAAQSVRPADLPEHTIAGLLARAGEQQRVYPLHSQMRVQGGADYIQYVREILGGGAPAPRSFGDYDLRFFDNLATMRDEIHSRDAEAGLSRLVAGYAWPWASKNDRAAFDIVTDGCRLRWNRVETDWINSRGSLQEVGSIHTVQGYDLNYAGVIVGGDLRYDSVEGRLFIDRSSYFDRKGVENNRRLGITYSDEDLLRYITNIYAVLMTRGMKGTYVYVVDHSLREHLRRFIQP
jgi:DUF2075 family protein